WGLGWSGHGGEVGRAGLAAWDCCRGWGRAVGVVAVADEVDQDGRRREADQDAEVGGNGDAVEGDAEQGETDDVGPAQPGALPPAEDRAAAGDRRHRRGRAEDGRVEPDRA